MPPSTPRAPQSIAKDFVQADANKPVKPVSMTKPARALRLASVIGKMPRG
jgi:hypothetical protein